MAGRLALVGGDEFRRGCESMDEAILRATGKSSPVVLIVPTAAAFENPARAADNGVTHFSALGADARPLMVLDRSDAESPEVVAEVESTDVVYLTGGSPIHLLEVLQESALLDAIINALERGAVLAGSSAGAMVMGSWMRFREWRPALGIADGVASLPHHERSDPNAVSRELRDGAPDDLAVVLGIDGRSGAISGPDGWTVLGAGHITVYHKDGWDRLRSGDVFTVGQVDP